MERITQPGARQDISPRTPWHAFEGQIHLVRANLPEALTARTNWYSAAVRQVRPTAQYQLGEQAVHPVVAGDLRVERGGQQVALPDGDDPPGPSPAADGRQDLD